MTIGPGELNAIIPNETSIDHLGGDARRGGFEDVGGIDRQAHVFVAPTTFSAGTDVTDAWQWVLAVPAIEPVDDQEVVGAVDGDILRTGIGHGGFGLLATFSRL